MSTTFEINHIVHLSAAAVVPNPTVRKYTQNLIQRPGLNWSNSQKKTLIYVCCWISIYNYLSLRNLWKSYNNRNSKNLGHTYTFFNQKAWLLSEWSVPYTRLDIWLINSFKVFFTKDVFQYGQNLTSSWLWNWLSI